MVTDTVKLDGGELPDFSIPTGRNHPKHQIRINPNIYALLAEEKCLEAGVLLRYYETPVKAEFKGIIGKLKPSEKVPIKRLFVNNLLIAPEMLM